MRLVISGSHGLIGSALKNFFEKEGHEVYPLVRQTQVRAASGIQWDNKNQTIEKDKLENMDAVIHLAGASIAGARWTAAYKKEILESRVNGTKFLSKTLTQLRKPPRVFLTASAVGYYGYLRPAPRVDESSPKGQGFLAEVCEAWENAAQPAREAGLRVIHLRFGMVLAANGGALAKMLPVFKLGLGGIIGSGRQMISWIALDDIPPVVKHLIKEENISGSVNVVSPRPVSNKEFTKSLGQVLKRPTIFPLPEAAVKLLFGQMGEELLLGSNFVVPQKLFHSNYKFLYPDLIAALTQCFY